MHINSILINIQKYGFFVILLYCFEISSPNFDPKMMLMELDLDAVLDKTSGSSQFKQVFWILGFFVYAFMYVTKDFTKLENLSFNKVLAALTMLAGVCFISALWSQYPSFTIKRSIFQILFITTISLSIYYACKTNMFYKSIQYSTYVIFTMIVISIILGVAFNDQGSLAGFYNNKNALGASVLIITALYYLSQEFSGEKSKFALPVYFLACVFILLSGSKTNIALIVIASCLIYLPAYFSRYLLYASLSVILFAFLLMPLATFYSSELIVISDFVTDDFITGRGEIWATIYYDLVHFNKLMFGYGYGSYFGVAEIPYFFDQEFSFIRFISSAHNGYIEITTQLGLLASIPVYIIFSYLIFLSKYKFQYILFLFPIIHNITESSLLRNDSIYWLLFILVVVYPFVGLRHINCR